jgi:DNA-directed RNA polymerase specialized sigma24 family protein
MGEISEGVYGKLLHRAERILPPDPALEAADLVQSAFAKACRWLDAGRPELEQLKYLYAVLNSVALDHRRRLKRRVVTTPLGDWCPEPRRMEEGALDRVALAPFLVAARTDPTLAMLLLWGCGWEQAEIAALAGTTRQAVKLRIWRWRHERAGLEA